VFAAASVFRATLVCSACVVQGPYRSSYSVFCRELQSPVLPLFVNVPNGRLRIGSNRDAFVPSPAATSPLHLQMLEFVGKLMGIAARNREYLNLTLAPLFWKLLVGETVGEDDLAAVDVNFVRTLQLLRSAAEHDSLFTSGTHFFTIMTLSGVEVPLVPGGASMCVTYANRLDYVEKALHYRLHEFDVQVAAILRGMGSIVPVRLLNLFTWVEVEEMVCGMVTIDVNMLRTSAILEGLQATDPHVQCVQCCVPCVPCDACRVSRSAPCRVFCRAVVQQHDRCVSWCRVVSTGTSSRPLRA
jgi:E3 ubiquitin-protein ligase HERC2